MPNLEDHEARIRQLERRLYEQDGVIKMLRLAALLLGIVVAVRTLSDVLPVR